MIQENPYLQYFCGYPGYDDEKLPFDPSLMAFFEPRENGLLFSRHYIQLPEFSHSADPPFPTAYYADNSTFRA